MTDESHYLALAAAYSRGVLGLRHLDDEAALVAGIAAELRLHRFKRTAGLPRVRRVLGALHGLGVATLLDVGSGRGAFLWPLLDAMPEVAVTAIDVIGFRVDGIEAVRRGGVARLSAARMDATRLGMVDDAVDAVTLLEVLEHMSEPAAAMREALRVARTAVIATVPSHEDDNPEHIHLFSPDDIAGMFTAAGARRVTTEHVLGHLVCIAMVCPP
jgi:SAM-dependent methyltransferase